MASSTTMEKLIESALIGMVLGDSYLQLPKGCQNAMMKINHCIKQKEYLIWKGEIIKNVTGIKINEYTGRIKEKEYPMIGLYTQCHPYLTRLREQFYWQGRKSINEFLMKKLMPNGLAIWIMDDGCFGEKDGIRLSTYNFTEAEHWLMKYWIEKLFNTKVMVRKLRQYNFLQFTQSHAREVLEICKDYIHPTLKYKFPPDVNPPICIRNLENGRFDHWDRGGDIVCSHK